MGKTNSLSKAPTYYRSGIAKGVEGPKVSFDSGRFGAGVVPGIAVITRGEALGHDAWVDSDFIAEVNDYMKQSSQGVKSRYTHPDISGDGLAKGLGRVTWSESGNPDIVRGDLHLWKSSRSTPEGDLGLHVLERATEDPASFGASISFTRDVKAEVEFLLAHGGKKDKYGNIDLTNFRSPDPMNVNNYPHVRLEKLRAVDIVDDPAANPDGLFARDEVFQEAEALLSYITGETTSKKPELVMLGVDADRVGGFLKRFLSTRGLSIVKASELGRLAEGNSEESAPENVEKIESLSVEPAEQSAPVTELSSDNTREELKKFVCEFGEQGAFWFIEGISFAEAQSRKLGQLKSENEKLRKELELSKQSETVPLSQGGGDQASPSKARGGFVTNIRVKD